MRKYDFNEFKVWCSDIYSLFVRPKNIRMPNKTDQKKYDKLMDYEGVKTEDELEFLRKVDEKIAIFNDPPLSKTLISSIINRYGHMVYGKKKAAVGDMFSFLRKGTDLELEGVELLSKIDKIQYQRNLETVSNEYLVAKPDIICLEKDKIVDVKINWNFNSYLKARTSPLDKKYWFQAQGYCEIFNVSQVEVSFLLLNTPPDLVEKEKLRLLNKFVAGEIERDKFESSMENLDAALTYNNIPVRRRNFKYVVKRVPGIFDDVYKKVEKARAWLADFDNDLVSNLYLVSSDNYLKAEENNTESDSTEPLSSD
jgi:hypothetical protein